MNTNYIVWTRMQTEAGQGLDRILKRKERERRAGGGQFFWGVGNAPSVLIPSLAKTNATIPVIFSRMKTKPKAVDENPASTVIWRKFIDSEGAVRSLPRSALVTSRGESATKRKAFHYALQCSSSLPLQMSSDGPPFEPAAYRNAGGTGAPVGNSQVTSLLVPNEKYHSINEDRSYFVDMRANLDGSLWVKLVDPVLLSKNAINAIEQSDNDGGDWLDFVEDLKAGAMLPRLNEDEPYLL